MSVNLIRPRKQDLPRWSQAQEDIIRLGKDSQSLRLRPIKRGPMNRLSDWQFTTTIPKGPFPKRALNALHPRRRIVSISGPYPRKRLLLRLLKSDEKFRLTWSASNLADFRRIRRRARSQRPWPTGRRPEPCGPGAQRRPRRGMTSQPGRDSPVGSASGGVGGKGGPQCRRLPSLNFLLPSAS